MSDHTKGDIISRMTRNRISAIIRTNDQQLAADAMAAVVAGGFRSIEFTLTTPNALQLISQFAKNSDLLVGAGTVLTTEQAEQAVAAGAKFLVSPVCDPQVIDRANSLGAVSIPGTFTATEMQLAHQSGADFVKLFPAPSSVPEYVRGILGPLPHLRIFPTAGVDMENFLDVLKAGAAGVGFVRSLFTAEDMSSRNFAGLEQRAKKITGLLAEAQV